MDLAFNVSSDHFTAEQNPAITAIIIDENHSVKGQDLITSRWSQPAFEEGKKKKKKPCSSNPLAGGVKWKVSLWLQDPAGQSLGPLVVFWSSHITPCWAWRRVTRKVPVFGHNLWSGLWYATVSDGGTRIASSLPDSQGTSKTGKRKGEPVSFQ